MRRTIGRCFVLIALGALHVSPAAAQQATPTPSWEDGLLATAPLDLPPAPTPIVLARITFATGSGLSMNANPGPALHFVESGGFEVLAGGPMTLYREPNNVTAVSGEEIISGTTFTIEPGDLLVIPSNSPFEVFNIQQEPAIALIIEMFDRPAGTVFPDGITLEPLVAGVAEQLPPAPVHMFLRRDAYAPGVAFPNQGRAAVDGPALVFVETGSLEYTVILGEVQISRASQGATPAAVGEAAKAPPSAEISLSAGDSIFKQMSTEYTLRNTGDESTVILVLGFSDADVGPYATPGEEL